MPGRLLYGSASKGHKAGGAERSKEALLPILQRNQLEGQRRTALESHAVLWIKIL